MNTAELHKKVMREYKMTDRKINWGNGKDIYTCEAENDMLDEHWIKDREVNFKGVLKEEETLIAERRKKENHGRNTDQSK